MPAAALKHYGGMVVDDTPKGQGQRKNAPYRMPRGVRRAQRRYSPQRAPRFLRASQPPLLTWRLPVCVDAAATMSGTSDEQADRCWTSTRESVRKRSAAPCWLGHSAGSYRLCAPLLRALRTGFGAATHLALRCFFAQLVCRSEPDEHGVVSNKCERTRQVLRHCAGRCVHAREPFYALLTALRSLQARRSHRVHARSDGWQATRGPGRLLHAPAAGRRCCGCAAQSVQRHERHAARG